MKILLFILLKIAEISLVVFGPYYLGKWVHSWTGFFCYHSDTSTSCPPMWFIGLLSICLCVFVLLIGAILGLAIKKVIEMNWELAGDLTERLKK